MEIGDKVKFINKDRAYFPEFFPEPGTIGEVVYADTDGCWVKWPEDSLQKKDENWPTTFYIMNYRLEKV